MLGEPTYMKAGGGQVGHGPWTKGQVPQQQQPQQQQQQQAPRHPQQGQPNPMKMPQGIPSAAPRSMDPRVMQQQMMQRAMMGQQRPGMGQQGQRPRMEEGGMAPGKQEDFDRFLNERKEAIREQDLDRLMHQYKQWHKQNYPQFEEAAQGGRIGLMYGGDPGFAFEYGGSWADWHDQHRNQMPVEDYIQTKLPKDRLPFRDSAETGGRIGFAGGGMGRRTFMKIMAGIASLPFIGKGITKTVPKVIPKVTETVTRGVDGMPSYIYDLIEVVKAKGTRDIVEGFKKSDYSTVHSYKGVDVTEDAAGNIKIKKPTEGVATDASTGKMHEGTSQEVHIEINRGGMGVKDEGLETQKSFQEPDEYFEGTVRPDRDGKMKDFEEGIDDLDHLELQKIADEGSFLTQKRNRDKVIKTKKASGGLAHMLGE
jgi:hypothetical protein